ncbi:hypothetical protein Tco_0209034 [Tanacetum coccineum]
MIIVRQSIQMSGRVFDFKDSVKQEGWKKTENESMSGVIDKLQRMIFDPNEEDDIWLKQQYWELLRWKLHEYSGVHSLFLNGTSIQINMLVEKKYPLKKEILEKMINLKIEAEKDSKEANVFERILSKSKSFNSRNLRFEVIPLWIDCKVSNTSIAWKGPIQALWLNSYPAYTNDAGAVGFDPENLSTANLQKATYSASVVRK